jgi:hypothetical protein
MSWSQLLAFPIELKDRRMLRTLADAGTLIGNLKAAHHHKWVQHAAELLMKAATIGSAEAIEAATLQVMRALQREGMI